MVALLGYSTWFFLSLTDMYVFSARTLWRNQKPREIRHLRGKSRGFGNRLWIEAVGTRTRDLRIKSPLLYHLSYSPVSILQKSSCHLSNFKEILVSVSHQIYSRKYLPVGRYRAVFKWAFHSLNTRFPGHRPNPFPEHRHRFDGPAASECFRRVSEFLGVKREGCRPGSFHSPGHGQAGTLRHSLPGY